MTDRWNIEKHLLQKNKIPQSIEEKIEENIIIYALFDLNEELKYEKRWIVLTESNVQIFKDEDSELIFKKSYQSISKVKNERFTSFETLKILAADDLPPVATIFYTGKQRIMMGQIHWYLSEKVEKENSILDLKIDLENEICPHEFYQQNTLAPLREVQAESAGKGQSTLLRLLSYLKPYKSYVALGAVSAVIATVMSLIPPYLSGQLIDDLIRPFQAGTLTAELALKKAWPLVIMLGATYLIREFFIWVRLNRMSLMGEYIAQDLRRDLYNHLQEMDMDFFSKKQTGSLISRVSSDTDRIWDFIAFGIVEVAIATITLTALCITLISLDWKLGLVMTLPVPILLWSIYTHGQKMKDLFTKCWRKWSDLTGILSDTIPGMIVVKAFSQQEQEKIKFSKANKIALEQFEQVHHAWTRFWPALMTTIHTITMVTWVLAVPRLFGASDALSAGTFVSFLLYMTMFSGPIEVIGQMARMMNRAISSAHRIFEVLDTKSKIHHKKDAQKLEEIKGDIEFQNVSFSYDGLRPILKGMNFKIRAGEMIGLVGSSGGGKSTITKLISRFYDVSKGEILIDGTPLKELDIVDYRKKVGMVLQEPYLFHGTIWENIAYGMPEVNLKDVVEAAKVANAHDFIMALPNGYETVIGERGHNLSGGERQRISIARAILHDPKILILDEATSAVDTETERKIQDALDRLTQGRTVIAIAHRLSTLRQADRIFVVNKGEIVESGKHKDLLDIEDGHYYKLHKMQKDMNENFAL